jgi:hypothetical protein
MILLIHVLKLYLFLELYSVYILCFLYLQKKWKILLDNVSSLTLKPLSQIRWKSWIESLKVIKFQTSQISDTLLQLAKTSKDPKTKSEANCLTTYEMKIFEFLLSITI